MTGHLWLYRGFPNPLAVRPPATPQPVARTRNPTATADLEIGDTAGLETCATGAGARTRRSKPHPRGAFDTLRPLWEAFARSLIPALIPKAGSGGPKARGSLGRGERWRHSRRGYFQDPARQLTSPAHWKGNPLTRHSRVPRFPGQPTDAPTRRGRAMRVELGSYCLWTGKPPGAPRPSG